MIRIVRLVPVVALGALGACLSVPDGPAPECQTTSDCDTANGEVCEEGVCWGNPPAGPFFALVTPPTELKGTLVSREFELASIGADGWLGDVMLEAPVAYSGQLRAVCPAPFDCTDATLAATITVTRPAAFKGGPEYRQIVTTEERTGQFQVVMPRTHAADQPYTITVVPEGRDDAPPTGVTPAQLVPPLRFQLAIQDSLSNVSLQLGDTTLPTVDGKIVNSAGVGQGQYRVVALGRWDANSPPTEVSTVDYTGSDGTFSIRLSPNLFDSVEIVARPYGTNLQPTLHVTNVSAAGATGRQVVVPSGLGAKATTSIHVTGQAPGGEIVPVIGAHVTVTGVVPSAQPGGTTATLVADATTNADGYADVELLDGATIAGLYQLSIVPPANATVGLVFNQPIVPGGSLEQKLPNRVALRGIVRDASGKPLDDVSVTVRPSLRFQWSLDAAPQAFVSAIPAATTTTPETGEFVVFVDPFIENGMDDVWGYYDILFEPTASANAPTWVAGEVSIPRDTQLTKVAVPDITLPDAAHIHGQITDPAGTLIEGAELKVFRPESAVFALCDQVPNAPASCPVPAPLLGRGASDGDGIVRLTLPRL
ncbi:MAG TPA: hypothetical protein VFQ53_05540 [Kofleriaceae bacterium]|nr:hypothetical protein [Kofleriaceae bacterium]